MLSRSLLLLPALLLVSMVNARNGVPSDRSLRLDSLRQVRDQAYELGDHATALATARALRRPSINAGDGVGLIDDMLREADILEAVNDPGKAADAVGRALFLAGQRMDTSRLVMMRYRLLELLIDAERPTEVRRQLMVFTRPGPGKLSGPRTDLLAGRATLVQGRPADALPMLHKALSGAADLPGRPGPVLQQTLLAVANAEAMLGRWEEAGAHLDSAMALQQRLGGQAISPEALALRGRIQSGKGQYAVAYADLQRSVEVRDSLLNGRAAVQLAALRNYHAVAEDQESLRSLQAESLATVLEITRQRERLNQLFVVTAGLVLLLAALLLVGHRLRAVLRRERAKTILIRRQGQEIQAKDIELGRQRFRLNETLSSEEHKAFLLKEIHHRVKNDLQITSTLLRIQACTSDDPRLMEWTRLLEGRIRTMAMVHESMYRFGDLELISVRDHISALAQAVVDAFGTGTGVHLDIRVGQERADAAELMPLSLLLHELITNTLKHGFRTSGSGTITIQYEQGADGMRHLVFAHTGEGIDRNVFLNSRTVGMELVRTLVAQLNGTIRMEKDGAARFNVYYRPEERALRQAS